MKRTFFVLLLPFLLGGCAQLFDSNLYTVLDPPPPLDKGALSKASVSEIKNMIDDTFLEQLQDDPAALEATQDALTTAMTDADATVDEAMDAAATLMEVTEGGSGVSDLKENALNNQTTIADAISAGNYTLALKIFMGNKTQAEIEATLDNLFIMGTTANFMMLKSVNPNNTINSTVFFSGTTNEGNLALSCLMGAVGHALVNDRGGSAALAAIIAADPPTENNGGADMSAFIYARGVTPASGILYNDASATSGTYSYAYVATIKAKLPFPL